MRASDARSGILNRVGRIGQRRRKSGRSVAPVRNATRPHSSDGSSRTHRWRTAFGRSSTPDVLEDPIESAEHDATSSRRSDSLSDR
ncbi:hypothetical protein EA472_04420 [Natrarchaeobius oligotrophus]|uniref:Uncharacterized protein n=1 Tax=Natrarchaeobius chitinivorans TaxID=1679083 RepID=A0A3N6PLZ0_NATCH|nr:hypothetical protein EA472_04420 [Natrarchaeobius chitinivorans]